MGRNYISKSYRRDGTASNTFTVPAGVKDLTVTFRTNYGPEHQHPQVALAHSGQLYSWGVQPTGDGSAINRSSPTIVSTSAFKAPFLRSSGQMVNWGINAFGQVGDNSTTTRLSPVAVAGGYIYKKVVRGPTCFGLAEDGNLYGWGRNVEGVLGQGDTTNRSSPTQFMPGTKFVDFWVSNGMDPDLNIVHQTIWAKDSTGVTWACGKGLGTGLTGTGTAGDISTPVAVLGGLDFTKIVASCSLSAGHAVGLTSTGQVYAWGLNNTGQLGDNTIVNKSSPVLAVGGYSFKDVGAGIAHSHGVTKDSTLYTWGDNSQGQLGVNSILPKSSPVLVSGSLGLNNVYRAYSTVQSMFAISEDRKLYSWGYQDTLYPILGTNDVAKKSLPTLVVGLAGNINNMAMFMIEPVYPSHVHLMIGGYDTRGSLIDGQRWVWGDNTSGQLANNNGAVLRSSQAISNAFGGNFKNLPDYTVRQRHVSVTPGQVLTIQFPTSCINIPELNLEGGFWSDEVVLEWLG